MTARLGESIADRISKYEASILRLESIRRDYVRRTPLYAKSFAALAVAGFACFAFGGLIGLWGSISATLVSAAGYAMVGVRVRELTNEIDLLLGDLERIRRAQDVSPPVVVATNAAQQEAAPRSDGAA